MHIKFCPTLNYQESNNVTSPKAIIFDMDGTLTAPYIDWKRLRTAIACPPDKTIIDHIESLPPEKAVEANTILLNTERQAAEHAAINDGAAELVQTLHLKGLKLALVTNNHREAMHIVLRRGNLHFDVALSRDDGKLKPAPDLILKSLAHLHVQPHEAVGIGDGRYDLMACEAAGVRCIYLSHGDPALSHDPSIAALTDLIPFLNLP
jgi:HAD superfamily hydrolase (TIGR01509 family)